MVRPKNYDCFQLSRCLGQGEGQVLALLVGDGAQDVLNNPNAFHEVTL
jgi:hypothetical protein